MKVVRVKTKQDVDKMVRELKTRDSISYDVETGGFDPYTDELRLMQFSPSPEKAFILDLRDFKDRRTLSPVTQVLEDPQIEKVGHNLKFDAKFTKHHLGNDLGGIYDTFIQSRVSACGDPKVRHGLDAAMERFLGIEIDKTEQRSDWTVNELSENQITYAAKDVCVMHELRAAVQKKLSARGLNAVAKLENDIVMAMAQTELNGFYLNQSMWRQQLRHIDKEVAKAAIELQTELSRGNRQYGLFGPLEIDLGSTQQVAQCLLQLGVPVPKTEKGNYTTKEDQIDMFKYDFPAVEMLQEWRGLAKLSSSYGENLLNMVHPVTGRLHSDFMQLRAPSGRMGSENPNLQNLPKEDEYRNCFQSQDGRKLVVADYSQIELRLMAAISEDQGMINAFLSGVDYHTAAAMQVFKIAAAEDVSSDQRTFAKRVNFGIGYGIGAGKLSRMLGISFDAAEKLIKQYFQTFNGLDHWLKATTYRTTKQCYTKTLAGRKANLYFDREDKGSFNRAGRVGCNIPIQGTAADIFKRALCLLHNDFKGTSGKIVNLVHDEFVVECDSGEADMIGRILVRDMVKAWDETIQNIPMPVDAKVMDVWAK